MDALTTKTVVKNSPVIQESNPNWQPSITYSGLDVLLIKLS